MSKTRAILLMEETIPNGEATSGYEFTISPGKLPAGKYQFSFV